jgi:dTDP-4-amino-4,6-dideoxygalactose transaminase
MDELRAAMGMVQLEHLNAWNERRSELLHVYRRLLAAQIPEIVIPFDNTHETAAHLMPVLLPKKMNRQETMNYLRDEGIQSSIHYPPVHQFTYYQERYPTVQLPKTEAFCNRELTLPLHPSLTENDVKYVVESLRKALNT